MTSSDLDALEALPMPSDKAELVARIAPARRALEDLVESVDEAAMDRVDHAGWRVRDHLSHISAWERMLVAHLVTGTDHEVVRWTPQQYANADVEQINARLYELHRDDPLSQVTHEYAAAHMEIIEQIERLADEDLARTYWHDDPSNRTTMEKIAGDTYQHYLEHRRWIAVLLQGVENGG